MKIREFLKENVLLIITFIATFPVGFIGATHVITDYFGYLRYSLCAFCGLLTFVVAVIIIKEKFE